MKSEDQEENLSKISLSAFHFQDLTIKVGNEKLYVNRDQLMEESPVFRTMLTSNFMEKDARLIEIPDKDPTTFALFLRHTLPGFNGLVLSESTARRILPLSHEYQTDTSLLKVDNVLSACTRENEYKSVDKLIDHILEAELYTLSKYLTASIQKASEFSPTAFERNRIFHRISSDTKANIFTMRCEAMESDITNCMYVLERHPFHNPEYKCKNVECGAKKQVIDAKTVFSRSKYINTSQ